MNNSIGSILRIIGYLIIAIGFILGLALSSDFGVEVALAPMVYGFVSGMMFLGFSEVIHLLQKLNDKFDMDSQKASTIKLGEREHTKEELQQLFSDEINWELSKFEQQQLEEFYAKKGIKIKSIVRTPFEDFCLVNGTDIVELGGFKPYVLSEDEINKKTGLAYWLQNRE